MTRNEAFVEMQNGHKIFHHSFVDGEYLFMVGASIYTEDNCFFSDAFQESRFNDGWSVVIE